MELERLDTSTPAPIPPFIKVIKDVTHDKAYSNKRIAKIPA
jgi:hypothetical protein